jgi:Ca-activated chloride channel family protein
LFDIARPEILFLGLLIPAWCLYVWRRQGGGVLFSLAGFMKPSGRSRAAGPTFLAAAPIALRAVTATCLIIALAGPQRIETELVPGSGVRGIGLVLDLSTSMLADDMEGAPSRLEVAREAAIRFAERRSGDELSLVAFGGEAVTRVPPTLDERVIAAAVRSLRTDFVRNGTDVSGAVLTAITQLLSSDREPRVVVLLTDGAHNQAGVEPYATGRAAAALGVRVHSISIAPGEEPGSLVGGRASDADVETILSGVSSLTGGRYFRAASGAALDSIYVEIDQIESQSRPTERERRIPRERVFLTLALLLLAAEVSLRGSRWGILR